MASDLKKVGLIFNADGSTDFVKSLKNVNASLQENYANFKLVQSQYDEHTKTSQKLKDKLEYLNNAYDGQKTKVQVLREELEELTNSENRDETAIAKKQTALKNAESQMNRYKNQIENTNKQLELGTADLKDFADKLDKTGNKINDFGKKASVISGAVVGIGAGAKVAFDEVDAGLDNVKTATGATGEQAEELGNVYKKVAQNVVGDFESLGSAVGEVNTRFGFTGETLEACTEQFVKFAKINGTDVTTSVQLVSRAMGDASIDSSEYGDVLDALSVAAQASGISIDALTTNIAKYGAPMRALGYNTKESISMFASWEKAGVNTEIAFSGMKKAISNFSAAGKDAKVEFKKILDEIEKCPDIASATTKAIEVFGAKAGPDLADAIKGGRFEFQEMLDLIEGSEGTVDATYSGLADGSSKAKLATQNLKLASAELGESLMANLAPIIEKIIDKLQQFTDWFGNLDESTKSMIVKVGLIIAAIGPLIIMFGSVAKGISNIIMIYTKLAPILTKLPSILTLVKGAISGVSAAMSFLAANPIVLIIAAIAAVVAGLIYLWNNCEGFRNAVIDIWNNITAIFTQFDEFLTNIFSVDWTEHFGIFGEVLNSFFANVSNYWNAIKQVFQGIIDFIKGVFTGNWSLAWEGVKNIFGGIFSGLLAIAKVPLNGIIGFLNLLISGINVLIKGINKIKINVPDWIPGIGGKKFGFSIKSIGKIPYLADGGTLLNGAAIVAEAGPELLMQEGNKTKVIPLTSNSRTRELDSDKEKTQIVNFNTTINNNDKYTTPAEVARINRNEMKKMLMEWSR